MIGYISFYLSLSLYGNNTAMKKAAKIKPTITPPMILNIVPQATEAIKPLNTAATKKIIPFTFNGFESLY